MPLNITLDHTPTAPNSDHSSLSSDEEEDSSGTGVQVSPRSASDSHEGFDPGEEQDGSWDVLSHGEIHPSDSASRPRTSNQQRHLVEAPQPEDARRPSYRRHLTHVRTRRVHRPPPSEPAESVASQEEWQGYARGPPQQYHNRPYPHYAPGYPSPHAYQTYPAQSMVAAGQQQMVPYGFSPYQTAAPAPTPPYFPHGHHGGLGHELVHHGPNPGYFPYPPQGYPMPASPPPAVYQVYSPPPPPAHAPMLAPSPATAHSTGKTPPPSSPPDTSKEDEKFARLEKLLLEQKEAAEAAYQKATKDAAAKAEADRRKAEEIAAASAAALEKAAKDAAARAEADKKKAEDIAAASAAALEKAAKDAVAKAEADKKRADEIAAASAAAAAAARDEVENQYKAAAKDAAAQAEADKKRADEIATASAAAAAAAKDELEKEYKAAAKASEEASAAAEPPPPPKDPDKPIKFKDAIGRRFSFPFDLCKEWRGMEYLIKEAFLHVDMYGPHVANGEYDLLGPHDEIIMKHVWETMIKPGWDISMHMWPIPEPPPEDALVEGLGEIVIVDEGAPPPPPPAPLAPGGMMHAEKKGSKKKKEKVPLGFMAWTAGKPKKKPVKGKKK